MLKIIREVFQKHRKRIFGFFLVAVISLILLGPVFLHIIAGEVAMFVIVLILLVYLELLGGELGGTQESMKTDLKDIKNRPKLPSIHNDQYLANQDLVNFIKSKKPKRADMLEYSTSTVFGIFDALVKSESKINLLLKNPKKALEYDQKERICAQIRQINTEHRKGDFEIRCYHQQASLRGRKFDNKLINVGWYTYDLREETKREPQIWGHDNPLLTLKKGEDGYDDIKNFFDKVFRNLKNKSCSLKEVCGKCKGCNVYKDEEWLDKVSKQR